MHHYRTIITYYYMIITMLSFMHHYYIIITSLLHNYYVCYYYIAITLLLLLLLFIFTLAIITYCYKFITSYYSIIITIGKPCNNESIIMFYAKSRLPLLCDYYVLLCHYHNGFYYYPLLPISVSRTCRCREWLVHNGKCSLPNILKISSIPYHVQPYLLRVMANSFKQSSQNAKI